ncbi:MAG: carboxypeptidase regulatory-like domain-containing protein, partial [Elusimicrobiales bacterium]|nr:carboxypeptidase regulatory-like domain-containing protein [Elusimicrobiales bacterium]
FTSPNYPPISKEIFINGNTTFDFDFDSQNYISAKVNINVVDESSSSVKGAKVILIHKTFEETAYTNDNGNCSFENIPTGLYKLEIHKDGYTSQAIKFSLNNQPINYKFILKPSLNSIKGKVYLSKFPKTSFSAGVLVSAYNETKISEGSNYVPSIKVYTEEDGSYEIKNVESGSVYRIVASYPGKLTQTTSVRVSTTSTTTYAEDIVFMDIPPQIDVKIKRYKNNIELYIKSPKEIANVPICKYIPGKYNIDNFDESNAVQLSLVKMPNNTYLGKFNISSLQNYYTIKVQVGDIDIVEKVIVYDVINDIANENYIYDKIYFGGNVYADSENNDYTGIEIDPGVFSQSTSTIVLSSYYKNIKIHNFGDGLIGGFFSALPSVKTTRTSKGEFTISQTIKDLMASDIYEIEISNVQPNKEFTLTLAYDKEKVITNTSNLRIYQYNENTSRWEEIIGTYTIDPMLGTVSVDVVSISNAYETNKVDITNPFMRERLGMSALIDGRFVPQNTQSSQKGKFAVFSAKPPTGTSYVGNTFEIYNIPNPFNLELKPVNISSDGGSWYTGLYQTQGTIIKYHLPQGKDGKIKLVIYNISGEKVRTIDEGYRAGGYVYYSEWDGRNDKNEKVSSGVYFLVTYLNGEKLGGIHKMAVIK